jgi:hypothetical protein
MQAAARPSRFRRFWFAPVWAMLGLARIAILILPFETIARRCGRNHGPCAWLPLVEPTQRGRARQVRDVIEAVAPRTPWRSDCLPQALVAIALLRLYRVPYAMCLGLAPGTGRPFAAHAWVDAGGVPVSGGRSFASFAVVACFVHAPA